MSYLMVDIFDDETVEVVQPIRIMDTVNIKGIRAEMYKKGTFPGDLTLEIYHNSVLRGTKVITSAELIEEPKFTQTYAHGYLYFEFDDSVFVEVDPTTEYTEIEVRISTSGYTFSEGIHLGIQKRFTNQLVTEYGTRYTTSIETRAAIRPYSMEIYEISRN